MPELLTSYYISPIGTIEIKHNDEFITVVGFVEKTAPEVNKPKGVLQQCMHQLDEYFNGKRKVFDLPLAPTGTDFQKKVWKSLQGIPYAATVSYLDIAKLVGDEKSTRAVGAANGKNPIGIIIPCHRVIGSDSSLTGYAGGMFRKKWLLDHEAKFGLGIQTLF
ncbi:MAG: methylated-DNA--[protein]-cysteine S-methyltransferase [Bacteroidetes bacterium]|nr:methylated-DNA--[protein]-cysteine S-methyltransferase [Bacteroidota bacterium]